MRRSLDVVLEKRIDSKTVAESEAARLRVGIVEDSLPARTRELLGLPASSSPQRAALTIGQLHARYHERHLPSTATADKQGYQITAIGRVELPRTAGTSAARATWFTAHLTADAPERLRESRHVQSVRRTDARRHLTDIRQCRRLAA